MRYTITFGEELYEQLMTHLFAEPNRVERAAYLLCRISRTTEETRLLVREFLAVLETEILTASAHGMTIPAVSFARAMKRAHDSNQSFIFIHSHPGGSAQFSLQDDAEERKLFRTASIRIGPGPHASLVASSPDDVTGRVWTDDGINHPVERVRVIGRTFKFIGHANDKIASDTFDRQVRAFGSHLQALVQTLTFGVVGAGGTGSSVCEQLIRLGAKRLYVFDGDVIDRSNVTRVYGSGAEDVGVPKVINIEQLAERVGFGCDVTAIAKPITYRSAAEHLKNCDVVFGCTDDEWGRSILNRLAIYYYIPVIDMGVRIDSTAGVINSVQGRVTVLIPGAACLFCRQRIGANISAEVLRATNPTAADNLRREGYIPGLEEPAPSVIAFTTAIGATAVIELIQRLTGFMGADRTATEILHLFDETRVRTNSRPSEPECVCSNADKIGRGDCEPFLDSTWRSEARLQIDVSA
jgi:molybdopterin/thiamine biosynthesis adenylyltransferase/proteasome lid subunit RPN8/RPN11